MADCRSSPLPIARADSDGSCHLRHRQVDCGAEDGFFEELLDPPPPPPPKPGKEKGHNLETPPTLGHSLIRLCKYNPEVGRKLATVAGACSGRLTYLLWTVD